MLPTGATDSTARRTAVGSASGATEMTAALIRANGSPSGSRQQLRQIASPVRVRR
ncbi:hypothetical protein [Streptomyces tubercidicus]|uniref:hypothetical protein n=1 Tax=Streptomyces tubercidicus TaxID=47759 RepID=UPI0037AAB572